MAEIEIKDIEKATLYYRTVALQLDFGAVTLRHLLEKHLKKDKLNLDKLKKDAKVQNFLKFQQECLKQVNSVHEMDITILTVVCEKLCKLSKQEKKYVLKLRDVRNTLAHLNKASLETQDIYDKTKQILIDLSKCVSPECNKFVLDGVRDLQKRKLIKACSNRDKLMLEVELLLGFADENRPPIDDVIWKKARLSLRVKDMARRLDMNKILQELEEDKVLTPCQRRSVKENHSSVEQWCHLVSLLLNPDTDEERFLRFCQCVRKNDEMLVNMIEEDETEGLKTAETLHDIERDMIRGCLEVFITEDIKKYITTEEIHILIETQTKRDFEFHIIETIILEIFKVETAYALNGETYFKGIALKEEFEESDKGENETGYRKKRTEMNCEEFSKYVGSKMETVKRGLGENFETAFCEESISSGVFKSMTQSQMKQVLSPYLTQGQKYGYGIEQQLLQIQKEINYASPNKVVGGKCFLRDFDRPTEELRYKENVVKPDVGNLLVPCHNFVTLPSSKHKSVVICIAKHVAMFAAACINCCKNGTIHFGIKSEGDGVGKIIGMKDVPRQMEVDNEIWRTIEKCFPPKHVSEVQRCIRPTQIVPVENGLDVLEIDIVPFSGNLTGDIIFIKFPIKGRPSRTPALFMFDKCSDIVLVSEEKVKKTKEKQNPCLEERRNLECRYQRETESNVADFKRLEKLLTGGNMYMTDAFVPLILSGQISGITNEWTFRNKLNLSVSYITAYQVFDFDHSVQLRQDVENEEHLFSVKVIKDDIDKYDSNIDKKSWIYCNGNTDVSVERQDVSEWYAHRCSIVRQTLDLLKKHIPQNRAIVIIYIFQMMTQSDPIFDIIKYCFLTAFPSQCVLISDQEAHISSLREALMPVLDEVEIDKYIFTSLNWDRVSDIFKTVCKKPIERYYKLPCTNGSYIIMNNKDREQLNDLEIISGEQCKAEFAAMNKETAKQIREKHEVNFFEGYPVSWWNFFFGDQVGKRRLYGVLKNEINEILDNEQNNYVKNYLIRHHPGAGGSTLSRQLLWHYSQFLDSPERAYRCCIIQNITVNTAEQIGNFREFKNDNPKPVLVLVDNKGEDEMGPFMARLEKLAYNKSLPGRLFCLVLIVQRFPLGTRIDRGDHILEHKLDVMESLWFEKKYKELENRKGVDIETLLAFNVMKNSFDKGFIKELTGRILIDVLEHEITLLECMAFINSFDSDIRIPECIFDELQSQSQTIDNYDSMMPFGILPSVRQRQHFLGRRILSMSETLKLLLKKHDGNELLEISILSQPLAESILDWIIGHKNITIVDVVENTLSMVCQHVGQRNPVSEKFVKRVSSLFKVRQKCGERKPQFSAMITTLKKKKQGFSMVVKVMTKCFDVTTDPMVGQQLARFYITSKKYEDAVRIIERCLRIKPNNSYLIDTYGQIHKTKMAEMLRQKGKQFAPVLDEEVKIVRLAFDALDKFQESQKCAYESNVEDPNLSLEMEVKTVLDLLDGICEKFQSVESSEVLRSFLNKVDIPKEFEVLSDRTRIKELRKGTTTQNRIEKSLRILEEKNYQVKREVYSVYVSPNEGLLLTLRDRFERWYNYSEEQSFDCNYGLGLKHLMKAKENNKEMFLQRVNDAEERIRSKGSREADFRDKMIFLGYNIIRITELNERVGEKTACSYELLLSCSTELVLSQKKAKDKGHRPYLEAFLYYAMIHWPSPIREFGITQAFIETLSLWKKAFTDNFFRRTDVYTRGPVPKTYFALGNGRLGQDIVDVESIRKQWRNSRNRKHVKQDNVWQEEFVQNKLLRLHGHVNETGNEIVHKVNDTKNGNLVISTYYPCHNLTNRAVTFILGFTWKGPTAMDVKDAYESVGDINNTHNVHQKQLKASIKHLNKDNDSGLFVPEYMRDSFAADTDQQVCDRHMVENCSSIRNNAETSHTHEKKTEITESKKDNLMTKEIRNTSLYPEGTLTEEDLNLGTKNGKSLIGIKPPTTRSFLEDRNGGTTADEATFPKRKAMIQKSLKDIKEDVPQTPVQETKKQYSTWSETLKPSDKPCLEVDLEQNATPTNKYDEGKIARRKTDNTNVRTKQYRSQETASCSDNTKDTQKKTRTKKKKEKKQFFHELSKEEIDMQIKDESHITSESNETDQIKNSFEDLEHFKIEQTMLQEDQMHTEECILPSRNDKLIQSGSLRSTISTRDEAVIPPFGIPDAPMSSCSKLPPRNRNRYELTQTPVQETKKQYSTWSETLKPSDKPCHEVELEQKATPTNKYDDVFSEGKKARRKTDNTNVRTKQYRSQEIASCSDNTKDTQKKTRTKKKNEKKQFFHELSKEEIDMRTQDVSHITSESNETDQIKNSFEDLEHFKIEQTMSQEDQMHTEECILPSRNDNLIQSGSLRSTISTRDEAVIPPFGIPDAPMSSCSKLPPRNRNRYECSDHDVINMHDELIFTKKTKPPKSLGQLCEKKQQDVPQIDQASSTQISSWADLVKQGTTTKVDSEVDRKVQKTSSAIAENATTPYGNSANQDQRQGQNRFKTGPEKTDPKQYTNSSKREKNKGKRHFFNSLK